jgi:hypothetical protein
MGSSVLGGAILTEYNLALRYGPHLRAVVTEEFKISVELLRPAESLTIR